MIKLRFNLSIVALCVLQYNIALAQEQMQLDTVIVKDDVPQQKIAEIKKTAKQLAKQQVQDSRDLVRYETGVSVVETGRFGASGYAIRGVDENRVAINIDGLRQAETLANQGFKELFEGYGNFNNTRNSVEIETLKEAVIRKGADSVAAGSGAIGGSVTFETKDARDFLTKKDWHLGYKTGYSTADNQNLNSITAAGRYKWFDALVVATKRKGHETENYGYKNYNALAQGKKRDKADPYKIEADSLLAKISFSPSENHRFTLTSDKSERTSRGHDFSYNLKGWLDAAPEDDLRHTNDKTKRKLFSISYENMASNLFWDTAKVTFSNQKITTKARTDDYCDGGDACKGYDNPYGLQLKNGKIVDKEGNTPKVEIKEYKKDWGGYIDTEKKEALVDSKGNIVGTDNLDYRAKEYWFDCSIFDCNSKIPTYSTSGWGSGKTVATKESVLDKKYKDRITGKTYATSSDFGYSDYLVIPRSTGYLENIYTDRDLNTNTKQLNFDFTKSVDILSKPNNFTYGFAYGETEKSMVNRTGYNARNPKWWANRFIGVNKDSVPYSSCDAARADNSWGKSSNVTSLTCPREDTYSFLIPVKTKDKSLYLTDNIRLHDRFALDVGFRYNSVKYKPNYVAGQTAKIPDDMVKGLFIPLPENNVGEEPKWWDYSSYNDPQYIADKQAYEQRKATYDAEVAKNPEKNIAYFSKPKKFTEKSYSLEGTYDVTDNVRLQAKYAKGFRMPTTDEMYFTFQHPDITVLPNVNLKPEIAKTKELALTLHNDMGFITGSVFRTDYKDFIDFIFKGNSAAATTSSRRYPLYQSVNRETARVQGFEINANLNVGSLYESLQGLNLGYKLTRQKGKTGEGIPMNAIQPMTSVFSVGYDAPSKLFGFNMYVSHVSRKKAEDTYNMFHKEEGKTDSTIKWRSASYSIVDLTGYFKPWENLTLQAGVYNLTNRKYITWDAARSIRSFGTSNMIDQETGQGINRFYAPGRNYKFNAELTF